MSDFDLRRSRLRDRRRLIAAFRVVVGIHIMLPKTFNNDLAIFDLNVAPLLARTPHLDRFAWVVGNLKRRTI